MPTNYPNSFDTFTTKIDNFDDVMAIDINNLQDSIEAMQRAAGAPPVGWSRIAESGTFISAASFSTAGDLRSAFTRGTKIRLENSGLRYGYVLSSSFSSPNTTVLLVPGSITLVNAAIANINVSYQVPADFPLSTRATPHPSGWPMCLLLPRDLSGAWNCRGSGNDNGTAVGAVDISVNQRHLTLVGARGGFINKLAPYAGYLQALNGTTGYLNRALDATLNRTNNFGGATWVNLSSIGRFHGIITCGTTTQGWGISVLADNRVSFDMWETGGTRRTVNNWSVGLGWNFIAWRFVWNIIGDYAMEIMLNGVWVAHAGGVIGSACRAGAGDFRIGFHRSEGTTDTFLHGAIDFINLSSHEERTTYDEIYYSTINLFAP